MTDSTHSDMGIVLESKTVPVIGVKRLPQPTQRYLWTPSEVRPLLTQVCLIPSPSLAFEQSVEEGVDELDLLPAGLPALLVLPLYDGGPSESADRARGVGLDETGLYGQRPGLLPFLLFFIGGLRPFGKPKFYIIDNYSPSPVC